MNMKNKWINFIHVILREKLYIEGHSCTVLSTLSFKTRKLSIAASWLVWACWARCAIRCVHCLPSSHRVPKQMWAQHCPGAPRSFIALVMPPLRAGPEAGCGGGICALTSPPRRCGNPAMLQWFPRGRQSLLLGEGDGRKKDEEAGGRDEADSGGDGELAGMGSRKNMSQRMVRRAAGAFHTLIPQEVTSVEKKE